jgi:hypothetical protein
VLALSVKSMSPFTLIAIGFVLILAGFFLPLLMVLRVLEPGFVLSFSAHFSSLIGLLLALYGAVHYVGSGTQDEN